MNDVLSFYPTLGILAAAIAGVVWFSWLERRPREFGRVRLVPTTPMLFLCALVAILMLVHLRTFFGAPPPSRPL